MMDNETLKAIRLALEAAWEKVYDHAHDVKDYYNRGWLFGFASAITTFQRVLNERGTFPLEKACAELGSMK